MCLLNWFWLVWLLWLLLTGFCYYWLLHLEKIYNIGQQEVAAEIVMYQHKKLSSLTRGCSLPIFTANEILLNVHNMDYLWKKPIYWKQVYTFQSNQIKLENPKSPVPAKRFIVLLLTTSSPRKPKVRFKRISCTC